MRPSPHPPGCPVAFTRIRASRHRPSAPPACQWVATSRSGAVATSPAGLTYPSRPLAGSPSTGTARFDAPGDTALDLTNAELASHLWFAKGVRMRGTLRLTGAVIHGMLSLKELRLSDRDGCCGCSLSSRRSRGHRATPRSPGHLPRHRPGRQRVRHERPAHHRGRAGRGDTRGRLPFRPSVRPSPTPAATGRSAASTRSSTPSTPSSRSSPSANATPGTQTALRRGEPSWTPGSTSRRSSVGFCRRSSCCRSPGSPGLPDHTLRRWL
jgi:hypothetical protein